MLRVSLLQYVFSELIDYDGRGLLLLDELKDVTEEQELFMNSHPGV
jgi:hypothetical protein